METIALYMRLSSEDASAGESISIANQRDLLYDFVRSHQEFNGCSILEFCDDGYSGVNFSRPGVQKLLSAAGKTVTCIIVKDFSRFGRNLIEVGDYLDQIFPFLGVRFIAVNEGYDSKQNLGSAVSLEVSLKAMIYEMYSHDSSEKIRCVQRAKMRKGEYLCAIAFYGYKRSETIKNKLEVDSTAAKVVSRIFHMAAEGMIPSKIAAKLNQEGVPSPLMYRKSNHTDKLRTWKTAGNRTYWTRENVRRIICDKRYTGCFVGHKRTVADLSTRRTKPVPKEEWIVAEDTHEAIITKETFAEAQKILHHTTQKKSANKPYQKFHGLIKCAYCNRSLMRTVCKQTYFSCPTAKITANQACIAIHLEEVVLENTLLTAIQAQIPSGIESALKTEEDTKEHLQEEIRVCQSVISRCKALQTTKFEDYAEGRIDKQDYLLRKQEIISKQKKAESHLAKLSSQFAKLHRQQEKTETDFKNYTLIKELTREILEKLVKEVHVSEKDMIEIQWN